MNYSIEFKFLKSNLWTKPKLLFFLKVKKFVYDDIEEYDDYFKVNITENIIYLGMD